jgi:hypothetical protein
MIRQALATIALLALASCGPNHADQDMHPKIVRLRSLIEHGVNFIDYSKVIQSTRGDFEVVKEKMSADAMKKSDEALSAAETLRSIWSDTIGADDVSGLYDPLHSIGAYKTRKEFDSDTRPFAHIDSSDSFEVMELHRKMNSLVEQLVLARAVRAVIPKLKAAEKSTE